MKISKKDCKFRIVSHPIISSPSGTRMALSFEHKDKEYIYTNIDFIERYSFKYECPKSLYKYQAKAIIDSLPDEFDI